MFCFLRLSQMIDGSNISENLNNEIKTNLKSLNIEFESYFPKINTESIQMRLANNPFIIIMDNIHEEMENEFLSLVNNTSMKNVFKQEENISDFITISKNRPKNLYCEYFCYFHQRIYAKKDFLHY